MSQVPMMPVYPDALIGDTLHLSAEEFGAYMLLLFATWRNNGNPLPNDARKLPCICRCSVPRWNRTLRPALIGFFRRDDDGLLHQKRLEKEWAFCAKFRAKQAANGAQGGRPRKSDKPSESKETDEPNGPVWQNPNHNPNESPLTLVGKGRRFSPKELNLSSLPTARDATPPPLPSRGDGDAAALRAPMPQAEPEGPSVFDDPALKAYGLARAGLPRRPARQALPLRRRCRSASATRAAGSSSSAPACNGSTRWPANASTATPATRRGKSSPRPMPAARMPSHRRCRPASPTSRASAPPPGWPPNEHRLRPHVDGATPAVACGSVRPAPRHARCAA